MDSSSPASCDEENGVRYRRGSFPKKESKSSETPSRYMPLDWDPDLPYGGKVLIAKKKKPDPCWIPLLQISGLVLCLLLLFLALLHPDLFHFHVHHVYAHLGDSHAQHSIGQRYLQGKGVQQDHSKAMEWFRKAADQGHPHAAYNLAVGHMQGYTDDLKPGEAHTLIRHAASFGIPEAKAAMNHICSKGYCQDNNDD